MKNCDWSLTYGGLLSREPLPEGAGLDLPVLAHDKAAGQALVQVQEVKAGRPLAAFRAVQAAALAAGAGDGEAVGQPLHPGGAQV